MHARCAGCTRSSSTGRCSQRSRGCRPTRLGSPSRRHGLAWRRWGTPAERLARVLGGSRYVADLMARAPESVRLLADDAELAPRPAEALMAEFLAAAGRREDWEGAVTTVRGLRRRELLRTAMADMLGLSNERAVGAALADVAAATIAAALDVAT